MIFVWIYLVGCALAVLPMSRWFLDVDGDDDREGLVLAVTLGVTTCWAWPLVLLAWPVYALLKREMETRRDRADKA